MVPPSLSDQLYPKFAQDVSHHFISLKKCLTGLELWVNKSLIIFFSNHYCSLPLPSEKKHRYGKSMSGYRKETHYR